MQDMYREYLHPMNEMNWQYFMYQDIDKNNISLPLNILCNGYANSKSGEDSLSRNVSPDCLSNSSDNQYYENCQATEFDNNGATIQENWSNCYYSPPILNAHSNQNSIVIHENETIKNDFKSFSQQKEIRDEEYLLSYQKSTLSNFLPNFTSEHPNVHLYENCKVNNPVVDNDNQANQTTKRCSSNCNLSPIKQTAHHNYANLNIYENNLPFNFIAGNNTGNQSNSLLDQYHYDLQFNPDLKICPCPTSIDFPYDKSNKCSSGIYFSETKHNKEVQSDFSTDKRYQPSNSDLFNSNEELRMIYPDLSSTTLPSDTESTYTYVHIYENRTPVNPIFSNGRQQRAKIALTKCQHYVLWFILMCLLLIVTVNTYSLKEILPRPLLIFQTKTTIFQSLNWLPRLLNVMSLWISLFTASLLLAGLKLHLKEKIELQKARRHYAIACCLLIILTLTNSTAWLIPK
ncbi:hypothetical protein ACOME3_004356 [Neoechinorhynchus agilis]